MATMKVPVFTLVLLGLATSGLCYLCEEYGDLGCFNDELLCHTRMPETPESIGTTFTLFTRENRLSDGTVLDRKDQDSIRMSDFSAARETKFLVHGWTDSMNDEFWPALRDALLDNYDVNVVMVDWRNGAAKLYGQSKANTRVVGREIARLIEAMYMWANASLARMHIIGHSLGAHIGGYAGEACASNVGRISGLDPAGPGFSGDLEKECRLDRTDALFIDVLHTDGEPLVGAGGDGYGLMDQLGHQDFYPNGGKCMPGCDGASNGLSCDHYRAVYYFIESVSTSSCLFASAAWATTVDDIEAGRWNSCSSGDCPEMGYHADAWKGTGAFYLETNAEAPYCRG